MTSYESRVTSYEYAMITDASVVSPVSSVVCRRLEGAF